MKWGMQKVPIRSLQGIFLLLGGLLGGLDSLDTFFLPTNAGEKEDVIMRNFRVKLIFLVALGFMISGMMQSAQAKTTIRPICDRQFETVSGVAV
jgi:hypothetical protein